MIIFEANKLSNQRKENFLIPYQDDGRPLVFHLTKDDKWIYGHWDYGTFFDECTNNKYPEQDIDKVILL